MTEHKHFCIDIDGVDFHIKGDPNMSPKLKNALLELGKAAIKQVEKNEKKNRRKLKNMPKASMWDSPFKKDNCGCKKNKPNNLFDYKFCDDCKEIFREAFKVSEESPEINSSGCWEIVVDQDSIDSDEEFWRVRWSIPNAKNEYLYAAHYGGNGSIMNKSMAKSTAERWNKEKKHPVLS